MIKTLACGLATITFDAGAAMEEVAVTGGGVGDDGGAPIPGLGTTVVLGRDAPAGAFVSASLWAGGLGGKSDLVLEAAGEPVIGGAVGFGGSLGMAPEGGRIIFRLGIGFVTAVVQTGAVGDAGTAVIWEWIGSVVAAEILGRGVILVDAGFKGRGGRLIRSVSRLGAFESDLSEGGTAESAIIAFYTYLWKMFNCEIGNRNTFGHFNIILLKIKELDRIHQNSFRGEKRSSLAAP